MKKLLFFLALLPLFCFGQGIPQQSKTPASGTNAGNSWFLYYSLGVQPNGYMFFPYATNASPNRAGGWLPGMGSIQWSDSTFQVVDPFGHLVAIGKGGSGGATYFSGTYFAGLGTSVSPITIIANSVFPSQTGNAGNFLTTDGTNILFSTYVPENVANKATDFTTLNNTLYPTTQAVANYVASSIVPYTAGYGLALTSHQFSANPLVLQAAQAHFVNQTANTLHLITYTNSSLSTVYSDIIIPGNSQVSTALLTGTQQAVVKNEGSSFTGNVFFSADFGITASLFGSFSQNISTGYTFPMNSGSNFWILTAPGSGVTPTLPATFTAAGNYVTSIALNTPSVLYTNPINWTVTSGAASASLVLINQTANTFLAGPGSGSSASPTFRTIVAADIPTLNQNTTGTAANITAISNSTLTTLSALSLPYSQLTGAPATSTFIDSVTPSGAVNGTNMIYTIPDTPISGSVHLFLNGVRVTTFTISGSTITWTGIPASGSDTFLADYRK